MAEQLAVEVDVKNVMEQQYTHTDKPLYLIWIPNNTLNAAELGQGINIFILH